jgi:GH43 family beta-xylosidase
VVTLAQRKSNKGEFYYMSKKSIKILSVIILLAVITVVGGLKAMAVIKEKEEKTMFNNPIKKKGADPWIFYDNGYYYSCYSSGGDKIYVSRTKQIEKLEFAEEKLVWQAPIGTAYSKETWAPELHRINDKWYIYFAADDGDNKNHRMYCLEGIGDDPQGEYKFKGKLAVNDDKWAIDGTVLNKDGQLYFIWSGWEGDVNISQNIYIAKMSNPYTLTGDRVLLSTPTEAWETIGTPNVNEGPQLLMKGKNIHIVYSASGSWTDDYCLGLLSNENGDIMDPKSWKKTGPVFSKTKNAYGPGHCSFSKSPDGKEDWIFYHANIYSGTGWAGRSIRAQKFTWKNDYPIFGVPIGIDEKIKPPSGQK